MPGRDFRDQLRLIIQLVGTPDPEELAGIADEQVVQYVRAMEHRPRMDLAEMMPRATEASLRLMWRMLRFDPGKRVTALEALKDPYLAAYTTGDEAAQCGSAAAISRDTKWLAGTGAFNVSKLELQNMVFQEMIDFHPETVELAWGAQPMQAAEPPMPVQAEHPAAAQMSYR